MEAKLLKDQKQFAEIRKKKAIPTRQKIPCCSTGVRGITYTCKPDKNHGNLYLYPEFYIYVAEGHKRIAILSRGWERAWEEACKVLVKLKGFRAEELENFLNRIPDQAEKEKAIKEHLGITSFGNQGK